MARLMALELTLDEQAARAAYEAFTARNERPVPWASLPDFSRATWRHVAAAVLGHVRAVS